MKQVQKADLLIGAVLVPGAKAPKLVTEKMVASMKLGAVIVDVAIDQGGSVETIDRVTTHENPSYVKHGVVHYCVPNTPALVARTASISLSNILIPVLLAIADNGGVDNYIKKSKGFRKGVYIYHGILTNPDVGQIFNIPAKDIDLLLAVF